MIDEAGFDDLDDVFASGAPVEKKAVKQSKSKSKKIKQNTEADHADLMDDTPVVSPKRRRKATSISSDKADELDSNVHDFPVKKKEVSSNKKVTRTKKQKTVRKKSPSLNKKTIIYFSSIGGCGLMVILFALVALVGKDEQAQPITVAKNDSADVSPVAQGSIDVPKNQSIQAPQQPALFKANSDQVSEHKSQISEDSSEALLASSFDMIEHQDKTVSDSSKGENHQVVNDKSNQQAQVISTSAVSSTDTQQLLQNNQQLETEVQALKQQLKQINIQMAALKRTSSNKSNVTDNQIKQVLVSMDKKIVSNKAAAKEELQTAFAQIGSLKKLALAQQDALDALSGEMRTLQKLNQSQQTYITQLIAKEKEVVADRQSQKMDTAANTSLEVTGITPNLVYMKDTQTGIMTRYKRGDQIEGCGKITDIIPAQKRVVTTKCQF